MNLVKTVKDSIPGLETDKALDEHKTTVLRFIEKEEAVAAFEEREIVGALLFSKEQNAICFLAVDPKHRKKGLPLSFCLLLLMNSTKAGTLLFQPTVMRTKTERRQESCMRNSASRPRN